jgi:hypothetical protein
LKGEPGNLRGPYNGHLGRHLFQFVNGSLHMWIRDLSIKIYVKIYCLFRVDELNGARLNSRQVDALTSEYIKGFL